MKRVLAILLLLLAGCTSDSEKFGPLPSDLAPLFGGGGGGGGAVAPAQAPAQPAPGSQAPGTGAAKMLQDPEAREESTSEYVYAFTDEEAESICQDIASRRGWRLDGKQAERFVNTLGKRKYTCFWTIFTEPSYDNDKHY